MSLQIGQQLGSYQITSLIGKGGMGEVYRAKDTKLKRDVAIKILPDEFSQDTDRVSRFQREAESLAALNHQNIAAIYDLQQSDATRFLILEFVEGDTLADILKKRGALPVDEALQIAKQICEALEAAHEKGIIHRDLKPANVKITPDGKVKVLDFGLAKAFEAEASKTNLSQSPTLSMAATNAGVILGTAAYMSPEQAKGRTVDRRTDIFAFGCVLYEMLTGRAAFDGDDVGEILARVIEREPDWSKVPSKGSQRIHELLRRCLQKDLKKRRRDAGDLRVDIEQALTEPVAALSTPLARSSRQAWAVAALFGVALIAAVIAWAPWRSAPLLPETRTDIVTPATTDPMSFALSPDGRQIVFVASGDGASRLWLRSLATTTAQPLAGTEGASYPFWSPDSRSVGFFAGGKLKRSDIGGSLPQTLANAPVGRGGTWSPGGVILFAPSTGPLFRISASGGEAVAVSKVDPQMDRQTINQRFPYFLPGGKQFLFYAQGIPERRGIYLGVLGSEETQRLTAADTAGLYVSPGWLLFVRQGTLVAQHFDPSRKAVSGDSITVADLVDFDPTVNFGAFSVSRAGVVTYRSSRSGRQLTWFDRIGKALGTVGAPDEIKDLMTVELSPDGRRVAAHRTTQPSNDVWIFDVTRGTRFTFDTANERDPIWSPDGGRIVFRSNRKGTYDLYQKPSSGSGNEELLLASPQDKVANAWSPDGRFILYTSDPTGPGSDLWVLPLQGDRKPYPFLSSNFEKRGSHFSPDGRWVAYQSNESGRFEIYVRPFPEPGGQWLVSTSGGSQVRWAPDGKELYYIASDGKLMAVPIAVKSGVLEPGAPVPLFQTRIRGGGANTSTGNQYDVASDGRFLIYVETDDASPITLLQNWNPPTK